MKRFILTVLIIASLPLYSQVSTPLPHREGQGESLVSHAAYEAGRRRMVPIFLTTATTAVGVVPMIIAATNFWMPVGVTIFAGGIGSLILVVTVLPVVYWQLEKKKNK